VLALPLLQAHIRGKQNKRWRGAAAVVDTKALEGWMDAEGVGAGPIRDVAALSGGTQNILLRFCRGDAEYVLRHPPAHPRPESNETMRREARVLAALAGSDVPHPTLVAACGDESVLGAAFYLMVPVDGFNPVAGLPPLHAGSPAIRRRMGLAMAEGIAALGAVDHARVGLGDFGRPENYLERQVARWKKQLDGYAAMPGWTDGLPGVARVAAWLDANRPAHFIPGIIHGDYHLANVMFRNDGPELAAIVDWELATIGDPLIDLGWLLATWPADDGGESTVRVEPRSWWRIIANAARAICRRWIGTRCWPATSSAYCSKEPTPAPAPAKRPRMSASVCTAAPSACSSARRSGSDDKRA
jgi:aminoglycoside phosphotransferase (APT) family kinase protein